MIAGGRSEDFHKNKNFKHANVTYVCFYLICIFGISQVLAMVTDLTDIQCYLFKDTDGEVSSSQT